MTKKMYSFNFFSLLALFFTVSSFANSNDKDTGVYVDSQMVAAVPDISPLHDGGNCFALRLLTPWLLTTEKGTPAGPGVRFIVECVTDEEVYDFGVSTKQKAYQSGRQYSAMWTDVDSLEIRDSLGFTSIVDLSEFNDTKYSEYQRSKEGVDYDERQLLDVAFLAWTIIDESLKATKEPDFSLLATQSMVFYNGGGTATYKTKGGYPRVSKMTANLICPTGSCIRGQACNTSSQRKKLAHGSIADDCGHIVGRQLGGTGGTYNSFPQNRGINRGAFAQHENGIRDALQNNLCPMRLKIVFGFASASANRPNQIIYTGTCLLPNGSSKTVIFSN